MDEIEIAEYDPHWPELFAKEAALLRVALDPNLVVGLEHFGSTAVPGLATTETVQHACLVTAHGPIRSQRFSRNSRGR